MSKLPKKEPLNSATPKIVEDKDVIRKHKLNFDLYFSNRWRNIKLRFKTLTAFAQINIYPLFWAL